MANTPLPTDVQRLAPVPPETMASLRHQRNILGETLGRLLVSIGAVCPGVPLTGPELLSAAEDAIEHPPAASNPQGS